MAKLKKSEIMEDIRRKAEFKLYVLWKSLPPILLKQVQEDPDLYEKTGFGENPVIKKLFTLRTQNDFAKEYKIDINTLSDWNKKIELRDPLADIRRWAKLLTRNMLMAMYNKGLKYGDSYRVELWLKAIHGWSDKSTVELTGATLADVIKASLKKKK